ncbi:MAG: DUF202 domain-containing protein [Actinomycetes bacterium]
MSGSQGPWDAGLQPERTTLAWVRTALTTIVVCLLAARLARSSGLVAVVVGLGGTVASAALVTLQARRHYRRDTRLRAGVAVDPALLAVLGVTVLAVLVAAAALALVLFGARAG